MLRFVRATTLGWIPLARKRRKPTTLWTASNDPVTSSERRSPPASSRASSVSWIASSHRLLTIFASCFCDLYGEDVAAKKFGIDDQGVANLRVVMHKGRLALRPFNLLQFCWMQRLQSLLPRAGAADVSRCLACGDYVVHNARQGRPSNYCSDACKYRQWRKNKKLKKPR